MTLLQGNLRVVFDSTGIATHAYLDTLRLTIPSGNSVGQIISATDTFKPDTATAASTGVVIPAVVNLTTPINDLGLRNLGSGTAVPVTYTTTFQSGGGRVASETWTVS